MRRINVNNSKETPIKVYNKNSKPMLPCTMIRVLKKKLFRTLARFIFGNSLQIRLLRACGDKIGRKVKYILEKI